MSVEPTIGLALLAGFVSFISPCVLPLVPAYVGYMSGHATNAAGDRQRGKFSTFLHGLFFVLGFTFFFVGFGLLTAKFSQTLADLGIDIPTILTRLGGVAVIFFGLYVMKLLDPVFRRGLKLAERMKTNPVLGIFFTLVVSAILLAYLFWVFETYAELPVLVDWIGGAAEEPSVLPIILPFFTFLLFPLMGFFFHKPLRDAASVGEFWYEWITWLQTALVMDTRKLDAPASTGYIGSGAMGIVFAAGWTPCIGPIYGSVLTLASDSAVSGDSLAPAAGMLTAYSLGLGMPFLVMALGLNQMTGLMKGLKRNMRKVEYASGALLILIGVLILSGRLEEFSRQFGTEGELGELSTNLEACTAGVATGRINAGSWPGCVGGDAPKLFDRIVFASVNKTVAAEEIPDLAAVSQMAEDDNRIFTVDPDFDYDSVEVGLEVGDLAPDFMTVTPDGEEVSLSDFRGDVVLLNFWATWCGPCRVEMPEFQSVYDQLNPRGFNIIAVDFLEGPERVAEFAGELELSFPVVMDESGAINDMYKIGQYPTSYVVDGHGVIVARHAGIFGGSQVLEVIESIEQAQSGG